MRFFDMTDSHGTIDLYLLQYLAVLQISALPEHLYLVCPETYQEPMTALYNLLV